MTEAIQSSIEENVPNIRSRTIPYPEIDRETNSMMGRASRIKTLLSLYYVTNRRRLTVLRELIRERWWRWNAEKYKNIIEKVDLDRHSREF